MVLWVGDKRTLEATDDWASTRLASRAGEGGSAALGTASSAISTLPLTSVLSENVVMVGAEPVSSYETEAIVWEGRTFVLNQPITCAVNWSEGFWTIDFELVNASAYGRTRGEAIEAFQEEFAMLYDHYAVAEDAALAPDAIPLKGSLRRLVKEVREG